MAINEWLSEVYGTGSAGSGDDLEKTAQSMMLEKLAEQEGIDLSGLDGDQLNALAQQIISDAEGMEQAPDDGAPSDEEEEAQAKFAEADFLGRVMAHSYTQELNKIAEEAAAAEGEKKVPPQIAAAVAAAEKKEEKKEEKEEEKSAGILASAIRKLGGSIGDEEQQLEEYVEKRAEALAVGWLQENGYIK